jgi:hypothetical protein
VGTKHVWSGPYSWLVFGTNEATINIVNNTDREANCMDLTVLYYDSYGDKSIHMDDSYHNNITRLQYAVFDTVGCP